MRTMTEEQFDQVIAVQSEGNMERYWLWRQSCGNARRHCVFGVRRVGMVG